MSYLTPDIINDEVTVAEGILAAIADRIPEWQPAEGHVETVIAETVAIAIATAVTALHDQAQDSYMGFGERILELPRIAASVASTTATFTLDTLDGMTIPAGTEVVATTSEDVEVTFVTVEDVEIAPGVLSAPGVDIVAIEAGPDFNGAMGEASTDLDNVALIELDAPAGGGRDEEPIEDYISRLVDRARRLRALPITPADYAAFALDVPGIGRCIAINRFDPGASSGSGDDNDDAPGHLTLIPVTAAGEAVSPTVEQALLDYIDAIEKVINVVVHVAAPQFVSIDIDLELRLEPDADPEILATAESAIRARLDRATFDADPEQPGGWTETRSPEITIFDAAAAVDDLPGIAAVTDAAVNGAERVALPGPVSLPIIDQVTVTAP